MDLKKAEKKLRNFAELLIGNRVLDLFLKYNGIKLLTSATLVPFALILGKKEFEKTLQIQKGGVKLPVIDDPLLGNVLKLGGISTLSSISPNTLVPIGVLMLIYHIYQNNIDLLGNKFINNAKNIEQYLINQTGGNSIYNYAYEIFDNRILDLFLKYQGIKLLNSATLVPFGLIYSKEVLENYLMNGGSDENLDFINTVEEIPNDLETTFKNSLRKTKNITKNILNKDIPFIDDPLFGNYLKLSGLTLLQLNPNTLIPLGLLMILSELYLN